MTSWFDISTVRNRKLGVELEDDIKAILTKQIVLLVTY